MARSGRTPWTASVPPAELQAVHERIDSAAGEAAESIFRALNLVRYTRLRTFRAYVTARRRAAQWRRQIEFTEEAGGVGTSPAGRTPPPSPPAVSSADVLSRLLASLSDAVTAGTMPPYALAGALQSVVRVSELAIKADADARAAEKHAAAMAELSRRQQTALDALSTRVRLTPEQVAEIRARVLGL